jgi:hypothetical protein
VFFRETHFCSTREEANPTSYRRRDTETFQKSVLRRYQLERSGSTLSIGRRVFKGAVYFQCSPYTLSRIRIIALANQLPRKRYFDDLLRHGELFLFERLLFPAMGTRNSCFSETVAQYFVSWFSIALGYGLGTKIVPRYFRTSDSPEWACLRARDSSKSASHRGKSFSCLADKCKTYKLRASRTPTTASLGWACPRAVTAPRVCLGETDRFLQRPRPERCKGLLPAIRASWRPRDRVSRGIAKGGTVSYRRFVTLSYGISREADRGKESKAQGVDLKKTKTVIRFPEWQVGSNGGLLSEIPAWKVAWRAESRFSKAFGV